MTVRLLASELVKDSAIQKDVYEQLCKTFECGKSLTHSHCLFLTAGSVGAYKGLAEKTHYHQQRIVPHCRDRVVLEEFVQLSYQTLL